MSFPVVSDIKTRYLAKLDDPLGLVFTDDVWQSAFAEAYDTMFNAMLENQVRRIVNVAQGIIIPAGTLSIRPQDNAPTGMGITDFGDFDWIRERPYGATNERFREMWDSDVLPQRAQFDRLVDYTYRGGEFFFVGATNSVELQIQYESSGTAPTLESTIIQIDSCQNFLFNYAIGVSGERKGKSDLAQSCMNLAVGPRFTEGVLGGQLRQLIVPLVRSLQKVQVAPRPFSAARRNSFRQRMPYISAQQGATGGTSNFGTPVEYSTATGSIIGAIDGTNKVFWINAGSDITIQLYRNGVRQTMGVDYTALGNQITFSTGAVPQPGDIVTADVEYGDPSANTPIITSTGGGTSPSVQVLSGSAYFTPGVINDGTNVAPGTIAVTGAIPGKGCFVACVNPLPTQVAVIGAAVIANGVVGFYIQNMSGAPVNLPNALYQATVIP